MLLMSRKLAAVLVALIILSFAPGLRAQPVETNLVRLNAAWRYNHADCLVGAGWTATNFDDTIGNGESIISLTVVSSSFGFSRLFCDRDQSLTEPTQLAPSITGSCDTS